MGITYKNESQLRSYYRETLAGDGVCTLTENEYVAHSEHSKNDRQLVLREFTELPATVDLDRSFMIADAQKLGQKTFQPVVQLKSSDHLAK
ncbi:MAG: hypothetical protein JKY93_03055 [Gammaproteobacteria bacterium]|nr:hypothetical protein [Gammaproteobacteria bacterium]